MTHEIDGNLADWAETDRLDHPGTGVSGVRLYGTFENDNYVFALTSTTAIGANTTFWLNTDHDVTTGIQAFGGLADTGAEYYVNFTADGIPHLYDQGGNFVMDVPYSYGAGNTTVEFSVPKALLAQATAGLDLKIDINDNQFLPNNYAGYTFTVEDPATLPPVADHPLRVGIVYSETSAGLYFGGTEAGKTAYSQLFMAAQNQAAAAGVPFDVLSEADLKDLAKISGYDALIFPSFRDVNSADVDAIQQTLTDAVYKYHVSLITAGDFMTNDQTGAPLAGDPYERMKLLLDLNRSGGDGNATVDVHANDLQNPMLQAYTANELVREYSGMATSWYGSADGTPVDQIATQTVISNGAGGTTVQNAVVGTVTGGNNVHFANESFLGDNNMLQHALDYVVQPASGHSVSLHISRDSSVVATRVDMDQAQETSDVSPGSGPGIYDKFLPIVTQWKQDYNFAGSYYIDIGNGQNDQATNWAVSKVYYDELLAMGNEIGSHSITHPEDTNSLTSQQIQTEFQDSRTIIEQQLGIHVAGVAVPGMPDTLATAQLIEQYYDYMSGGTTFVGGGYPGAIGHLTPGDSKIYIAPNMSSDFTLVDYQGHTAAEASTIWQQEYADLLSHSDLPIAVWTWHDYGPTSWELDKGAGSKYTTQMYTDFIQTAYAAGSEFIALDDLALRMASFDQSDLKYSFDSMTDTLTVNVTSVSAGKFAIDLDGSDQIKSVTAWYAYDQDSVFVDRDGGTFTINLGATPDDVTHITKIADRAELVTITGDGTNLSFSLVGEGHTTIDLVALDGRQATVIVDGVTIPVASDGSTAANLVDDKLDLLLTGLGQHDVSISIPNRPPSVSLPLTATVAEASPGSNYDLLAGATDLDPGDAQTLTVASMLFAIDGGAASAGIPTGLTYSAGTHQLSIDPTNAAFDHLAPGASQIIVAIYDITDVHGGSVPQTLTFTITGTNDIPQVAAALAATVAEGASASSYDLLTGATDVDVGDILSVTNLAYAVDNGTVSASAPTGLTYDAVTHSLTIDPSNPAFDHLASGVNQTIVASYNVTDANGGSVPQTATFTITGTNDLPLVTAALTSSIIKGEAPASFDLLLGATDVDVGDTLSITGLTYSVDSGTADVNAPAGVTYNAATHSLTIDSTDPAFASLNPGTSRTIVATYNVTDVNGASVQQTATFTIDGGNGSPLAGPAINASVTEGTTASSYDLLAGATDPNVGDMLSIANLTYTVDNGTAAVNAPNGLTYSAGSHSLSIDPTSVAFDHLALGATQTIVANYSITDSHGASVPQTATFTVTGTNDTPTTTATLAASVTEGGATTSLNLLAGATDPDDGETAGLAIANLHFVVDGGTSSVSAPTGLNYNAASHSITIDPANAAFDHLAQGAVQTITASYDVTDAHGAFVAQTATFTIAGASDPAPTSFAFKFTDAHVTFVNGHDFLETPTGTIYDFTDAGTLTFTDGAIVEKDGQPLVDDLYYYAHNPDVWAAHVDPDLHYAQNGWHEGRDPSAYFSTHLYLEANPDVAAAGINPLLHYDQFGWREGRDAGPNFDTSSYLLANSDVTAAHIDPLAHYLQYGQAEGRAAYTTPGAFAFNFSDAHVSLADGHDLVEAPDGTITDVTGIAKLTFADGVIQESDGQPLVDDLFYFAHNLDVWAAHVDPDLHYAQNGWHEGRDPSSFFSTNGYLANNPDVAAAHINPLVHYDQYGWKEGRDPGPSFDTSSYLAANPDVAAAHIDPLLHYLQFGMAEGRLLA